MALPCLPIAHVCSLPKEELQEYFNKYARYLADSPPGYSYAIRFGSETIFSDDTYELRNKFVRLVGRNRRKYAHRDI